MAAKRGKLVFTEDESTKQAYQKYQSLKQEVSNWHQERSSHWLATLVLAQKPPYLPIMDLPEDAIIELWQRLNTAAGAQISDAEAREYWKQFKDGQTTMNPELLSRLHLAQSGVAQLAANQAKAQGVPAIGLRYIASDDPTTSYICPVCDEVSTLAILSKPNGHRIMHCTSCGFEWTVRRAGCLYCGSEDAKQQTYLKNEEFPGIEMAVCQACGHYLKEIDARKLTVLDYMWEDLKTLPLNFAAEFWLKEHAKNHDQIH